MAVQKTASAVTLLHLATLMLDLELSYYTQPLNLIELSHSRHTQPLDRLQLAQAF
jgi:hypothetical protein